MENTSIEKLVKSSWTVDKAHTKVGFSARHMVISEVEGQFREFDINVDAGDDFSDSDIEVIIKTGSIDTGVTDRDNHLKSTDFFDASNSPEMKFVSSSMEKISDEEFKLKGDLMIRGISKPIELDVTYGGTIKDPWGNERAGFQIEGKLNRFDYDLKWNSLMETGGAVVGKMIKLNIQ
ncbi:MAG TPA: YceI family protein, partial [Ignavibacteriaceae bacterium]